MVSPVLIRRPQTWKVAVHTDVRARSCVRVCVWCACLAQLFLVLRRLVRSQCPRPSVLFDVDSRVPQDGEFYQLSIDCPPVPRLAGFRAENVPCLTI